MNLKMRDFLTISDGILRFMGGIHDSGHDGLAETGVLCDNSLR